MIFIFMKNKIANRPKISVMEGEGKTRSVREGKEAGGRLEVSKWFRVFVELSLEEMLSQRQSKACLYHGRDVFKEMN